MSHASLPDTHGRLLQISPLFPGLGNPLTLAVSPHTRWYLRSIRTNFITGAGGADRRVRLEILTGATTLTRIESRLTQAANLNRFYNWNQNARDDTAFIANEASTPIPRNLYLNDAHTIRLTAQALGVNDRFTNTQILTEVWIDG